MHWLFEAVKPTNSDMIIRLYLQNHTLHSPSEITRSTKRFWTKANTNRTVRSGCISKGRGRGKGFSLLPKSRLLETLESGGRGAFEGDVAIGELTASEGTPPFILLEELNFSFRERCRPFAFSLSFSSHLKHCQSNNLFDRIPGCVMSKLSQILCRKSATFPFKLVLLRESFWIEPQNL